MNGSQRRRPSRKEALEMADRNLEPPQEPDFTGAHPGTWDDQNGMEWIIFLLPITRRWKKVSLQKGGIYKERKNEPEN